MSDLPKIPKELDAIADVVLAYRPKPKTKSGKKRKRRAVKIAKAARSESENVGR
jgi:hypothetical protein